MPDYSFIANPQTSGGMQSLSSIMNMANTAQQMRMNALNIQQKQQTLPADIARVQAESKVAQETAGPKIQQAGTQAEQAATELKQKQLGIGMQTLGGLLNDPDVLNGDQEKTLEKLTQARDLMIQNGTTKPQAEWLTSQLISKAHQPGAVIQTIRNLIQTNAGPAAQAAVINAPLSPVTTPAGAMGFAQVQPGAPNAVPAASVSELNAAGGNAAPAVIQPGIQPAQREAATTDVLGQPAIAVKDNAGNISYKAPPGTNYKPVMQFPPGENAQTLPEVQSIRTQANTAGQAAPGQHFNNRMILELTPDAFTGTGAGKIANVLNAIGVKNIAPNAATDPAVAQSQLKHFISLAIEDNAKLQGANTDAARSIAASAVLPTDSPEKAIKNITKVNDAYVTGNELYNTGMEAAINNPGNQSGVFAARQFRNAWAQNFDPRITLLENAQKAGDTETINRVLGTGKQRAAVTKELLQKARTLQALSQGQL